MQRRNRDRLKMVLAVRAIGRAADGTDFDELIHTVDIALQGARIGGAHRLQLKIGQIVDLKRKTNKGRFKIVWIGAPGTPRTGHVGLQAIEVPPNFWGLELPFSGENENGSRTEVTLTAAVDGGATRQPGQWNERHPVQ